MMVITQLMHSCYCLLLFQFLVEATTYTKDELPQLCEQNVITGHEERFVMGFHDIVSDKVS